MKIEWLRRKSKPSAYIHIDAAINHFASAIFGEVWCANEIAQSSPFSVETLPSTSEAEQITRKIIRYQKEKSGSKIFESYSVTEEISREQAATEKQAILMWSKAYKRLIKHILRKGKAFKAIGVDDQLYEPDEIPNGIWWTKIRSITHTGYVRLEKSEGTIYGRLLISKKAVLLACDEILKEKKKDAEANIIAIGDKEMRQLRDDLKYLVHKVKQDEPRLVRNSPDNKPWVMFTHHECADFLRILSHARRWGYSEKEHYKQIRAYKEAGSDGSYLTQLGLGLRGKHKLNVLDSHIGKNDDVRAVARKFISNVQEEMCIAILASSKSI